MPPKKEDILRKYYKWYESGYAQAINLQAAQTWAAQNNRLLAEMVDKFNYKFSSIWRHEILLTMRYYMQLRKTEYKCAILRARKENKTPVIFALFYIYDGKIEYVCSCPTFRSADGEYRHRFVSLRQVLDTLSKYRALLDEIDNYVSTIGVNIHQDNSDEVNIPADIGDISSTNFIRSVFCGAWLNDLIRYSENLIENHITEEYTVNMFTKKDITWLDKFVKKHGRVEIGNMVLFLTRYMQRSEQSVVPLEVGQKFIPTTVHELENIGDISTKTWKEMFMTSHVGDLVINGICPSFPIINDWILLHTSRESYPRYWDNKVSAIKINHSAIVRNVVRKLEEARSGTYVYNPIKKREIYLSFNMEGLSQAAEIPIEFAEREMMLGEYITCMIGEHVGRTVADLGHMLNNRDWAKHMGPMFRNFWLFSKYIFEYIYGLYCLNIKLGMMHGDLHLNNITFFNKRNILGPEGELKIPAPYSLFAASDMHFIFPHYGRYSCFIDFSRSFMSENMLRKIAPINTDIEAYITQQKRHLLQTVERDMPEFYARTYRELQMLNISKSASLYKILMALDSYKLLGGFIYLIRTPEILQHADIGTLEGEIKPWLTRMQDTLYEYLDKNISALVKHDIDPPNPNFMLMQMYFGHADAKRFTPPHDGATLVDYFCADNPMQYNIRNYDKFPENVRLDYVIHNKIPVEEVGIRNYRKYQDYLRKNPPETQLDRVAETVRETRDNRRGLDRDSSAADFHAKQKKMEESSEYYFST